MKKNNKINVIAFFVSLIHIAITFYTDKHIFDLENINIFNYYLCKIIVFGVLIYIWNFIFNIIFKKDAEKKKYLKYFSIHIIPMIVILLLVWPGVWTGSDVRNFYYLTVDAKFLYYLNYLTSIFYIVGYMLFPCPSGAIVLQVLLSGVICSYIIKNCFDIYKSKKVYILYIPFLLFHTIFYILYANRPVMYGLCYMFLIMFLIIEYKKKCELNLKKIIFISFLTAIVSFWRSESIYLIIAVPIFMFITYKLKINIKNIMKVFIPIVSCLIIVALPQKINDYKNSNDVPSSRNLPIFVQPLSYMLSIGLKGDNLEQDLENIDKVLDIEIMAKYPSYRDTPSIWNEGGCIKNYTKEEYDLFIKSYINIIKNNFPLFLKTKLLTFASASGLAGEPFSSINLYNSDDDMLFGRNDTKTLFGFKVRQNTLKLIEGKFNTSGELNIIYKLLGNFLIPMLFIGIIFIYSIFRKNLYYFLLTGMLIGHVCIVFFTAPASYFMYYFNIYILGWELFTYFVLELLQNKKKNII